MNELPKSRSASNGFIFAISQCDPTNMDLINYQDEKLQKWFDSKILNNPSFGDNEKLNRERINAWNMCVYISKQDTEKALIYFANLWLSNPTKSKNKNKIKPTSFDSDFDMKSLIWTCLEFFLKEKLGFYNL